MVALVGSLVAELFGIEESCSTGEGFFHKRRIIQKKK